MVRAQHDGRPVAGRAAFVGHQDLYSVRRASDRLLVVYLGSCRLEPVAQRADEIALTRPRVVGQEQGAQVRVGRRQLGSVVAHQLVPAHIQHLQTPQVAERFGVNRRDPVVLHVQLSQILQRLELVAGQLRQLVTVEVEDQEPLQTAERVVVQRGDGRVVEQQRPQVLLADERVIDQLAQIIAVQIDVGRVHRYPGRDVRQQISCRRRTATGAVDDVGGPRLVVVAGAVGRAGHLAVAGVEIAAVAQGEAVGPVRAEEIGRSGFHQWRHGPRPAPVRETAVNRVLRFHIVNCIKDPSSFTGD